MQAADTPHPQGHAIRQADAAALEAALGQGRERLLAMFQGFENQLGAGGLAIAYDPVLNLPLWELGHVAWFEEWWIARNPARSAGTACHPAVPRLPSILPGADAFYDSARIAHAARWQLALPDAEATRLYLAQVRERTLSTLRQSGTGDDDLYFFRLVLLHEDMHREAWFMMAQQLDIDLRVPLPQPVPMTMDISTTGEWQVPAGVRTMGSSSPGFAFDNELQAHAQTVNAFTIDRQAVTWREFLPFAMQGGYDDERHWTRAGWQWRQAFSDGAPLYLRRLCQWGEPEGPWEQCRFGQWRPLHLDAPCVHLSAHEAAAWCRWAGRRLPSEAEWETAARLASAQNEPFDWGRVWEWTSSHFCPYPGFVAHPYREYSEPFFDGRPVLRGGSNATDPRIRNPAYRNYFTADRRDVFAGFRSCAL